MNTELISSQLAVAYMTSSILEYLKNKSWFPLLSQNTPQINRAMALIASFCTAIGVHLVSDWQATTGVLVITISGLTWSGLVHGLLAWVQQHAFQEGAFRLLVQKDGNGNTARGNIHKTGYVAPDDEDEAVNVDHKG